MCCYLSAGKNVLHLVSVLLDEMIYLLNNHGKAQTFYYKNDQYMRPFCRNLYTWVSLSLYLAVKLHA
jgi:hypothetical protein